MVGQLARFARRIVRCRRTHLSRFFFPFSFDVSEKGVGGLLEVVWRTGIGEAHGDARARGVGRWRK